MLGFVELNLKDRLRALGAVPYARRTRSGHYILEVASQEGIHILQRQRGGAREFKTFEALLSLLAAQGVVEFAVVMDDAKITPAGPTMPWDRPPHRGNISRAAWRHDFDIPF
ncbi:hypothetical protein [Pseudomonas putida]|uniref:hypothetical protein n=1 Tax=Pseudomonas putida TaxID=303 RepID=UPI0018CB841D|nr:hypothetical protein [Pseudomonas putida]MCE0962207.1 hypothetical protein [Pseudomonas putida]QPN45429.1 hypothetical protein I5S86_00585 [Priestia aryabhattai]